MRYSLIQDCSGTEWIIVDENDHQHGVIFEKKMAEKIVSLLNGIADELEGKK